MQSRKMVAYALSDNANPRIFGRIASDLCDSIREEGNASVLLPLLECENDDVASVAIVSMEMLPPEMTAALAHHTQRFVNFPSPLARSLFATMVIQVATMKNAKNYAVVFRQLEDSNSGVRSNAARALVLASRSDLLNAVNLLFDVNSIFERNVLRTIVSSEKKYDKNIDRDGFSRLEPLLRTINSSNPGLRLASGIAAVRAIFHIESGSRELWEQQISPYLDEVPVLVRGTY